MAVQSHFFGTGRVVPWAQAGVGAVATQSFADPAYGPLGLDLMHAGKPAEAALRALVAVDPRADLRQVAMVDALGGVSAFTGEHCVAAAGHRLGDQVGAQANMMARPTVWDAMVDAFERTRGGLADRLLGALRAAAVEGGDVRGEQSATLLVVAGAATGRPWADVLVDIRVDDHPEPLHELGRLLELNRMYKGIGAALGPLLSGVKPTAEQLEHHLLDLVEAQEALGDNLEPTFWKAVLLVQAGRTDDARFALQQAVASHAGWAEMLRRLPAAGLLTVPRGLIESLLD